MNVTDRSLISPGLNKTVTEIMPTVTTTPKVFTARLTELLSKIYTHVSQTATPVLRSTAEPRIDFITAPKATTALTMPPTPPKTSEPLQVLSFDFIDSKEFQERMAEILAGRTAPPPTIMRDTTTTANEEENFVNANLGILIPIVAFAIFILAVVACVAWQAVHEKIRPRTKKLASISTFYRNNSGWDNTRASTRSTTPLQMPLQHHVARDFVPQLDRISESPEDRLNRTPLVNKNDLFSPDSSLASMLSRLEYELSNGVRSTSFGGYAYPPPSYMSEVSQSYPNLPLPAQAPFSPYHLTWTTPAPARPIRSDPIGLNSAGRNQLLARFGSRGGGHMNEPMIGGGNHHLHLQQNTWKSPYHPNFNTPTDGSEHDSAALPPNAILNHISSSMSLPPDPNRDDYSKSASDSDIVQPENKVAFYVPSGGSAGGYRRSSAHDERVYTPGSDYLLGSGSNGAPWQYNRLYVHPFVQMIDPHAVEMGLSQNSSTSAMMGSSNTSMLPQVDPISLHEPQDIARSFPRYANTYALNDPALFLTYDGLVPFTPAPPYEGYHTFRPPLPPADPYARQPMHSASNNTSTCGQMDSLETSMNTGSTVTISRNTSGYTAGPSHSTSINGQPLSNNNSTVAPSQNSSMNSSKINSMSSIAPVKNEASAPGPKIQAHGNWGDANRPKNPPRKLEKHAPVFSYEAFSNASHVVSASDTSTSTKSDTVANASSLTSDGMASHSHNTTSYATSSSVQDQSQQTTAPASLSSLQWDSFSFNRSVGNDAIDTNNNAQEKVRLPPNERSSLDRAAFIAAAQINAVNRRHPGLAWDTYPFYTPNGPKYTSSMSPGNTGPPPPRPSLLNQPQYWV